MASATGTLVVWSISTAPVLRLRTMMRSAQAPLVALSPALLSRQLTVTWLPAARPAEGVTARWLTCKSGYSSSAESTLMMVVLSASPAVPCSVMALATSVTMLTVSRPAPCAPGGNCTWALRATRAPGAILAAPPALAYCTAWFTRVWPAALRTSTRSSKAPLTSRSPVLAVNQLTLSVPPECTEPSAPATRRSCTTKLGAGCTPMLRRTGACGVTGCTLKE